VRYTLTIREPHRVLLESILVREDGHEGAAYLLCGIARIFEDPWTGSGARRLLVREVIPVANVVSRSETHVTWGTEDFVRLAGRCEREGLTILVAHSHPAGCDEFSLVDERSEKRLFLYALDKLGDGAVCGSVLMRADRSLIARVWLGNPVRSEPVNMITTIGNHWRFESSTPDGPERSTLHRQALALGSSFNARVGKLRVGVVGCGATGSAAALLLARLGVGHLVLIDADIVDTTNLHRLHGATQSDADAGRRKAEVLRDEIASLGLGCKVRAIPSFVESPDTRDAIRSCDVIFSCTDDHLGRAILSRLAYFYLEPVIDVGVALRMTKDKLALSHVVGRVTVLQPDAPCLSCRGTIDARKLASDAARRGNPETYERLKAEGYILGAGDPSPAVITFTTETASMGVIEFMQRLTVFRGEGMHSDQRYRHFLEGEDSTGGNPSEATCRICGRPNYWAKGDVDPFLDMTL
jgi:molybdopterin/thiamine biosynthesis adenylyltransferase